MVLCFIALPVFLILGIFSAKYRQLAKESIRCVFLKATFRPCDVGLDTRVKASIVGNVMRFNKTLGRLIYKYFIVFSWIFTILLVASTYYTAAGGINYYLYGNCNGLDSTDFCLFDPSGHNSQVTDLTAVCGGVPKEPKSLTLDFFNSSLYYQIDRDEAINEVVIVGCYECKYTRDTFDVIQELIAEETADVTFAHLPIHPQNKQSSNYANCVYEQDQEAFWEYNQVLFNIPINQTENTTVLNNVVDQLGVNVSSCVSSNETIVLLDEQIKNLKTTNVYGTPSIFINGEAIVGPKPRRVYMRLLD